MICFSFVFSDLDKKPIGGVESHSVSVDQSVNWVKEFRRKNQNYQKCWDKTQKLHSVWCWSLWWLHSYSVDHKTTTTRKMMRPDHKSSQKARAQSLRHNACTTSKDVASTRSVRAINRQNVNEDISWRRRWARTLRCVVVILPTFLRSINNRRWEKSFHSSHNVKSLQYF